ncbi:hypothetical protein JHD50_12035 [Sulfurimonas sp. MAG313]|nr:hypothetical protein [Sulfurimonas sp. MAG313]MDF1882019.1 hypothetical protein [Sulfurimonas sp. MAG313]
MYINNNNSFLYSQPQEKKATPPAQEKKVENTLDTYLKNFSEKAQIAFDTLSSGMSQSRKKGLEETLNSIGKAASFSSLNGFDSQSERLVVSQYFGNFDGVLSDDAIKKMILSRLDNLKTDEVAFFQDFAKALDSPLKSIDITV